MPKLKRFKRGEKVDLTTWDLQALDDIAKELFRERFLRAVGEAIECAVLENTWAEFADKKPDIVRIDLPFGASEYENPSYDVSLTDLIKKELIFHTLPTGEIAEGESAEWMTRLRDHLRTLAQMIDDKLPR